MTDQTPEGPIIEVNAVRLVCASHGEHLRPHWPMGAATVMVVLTKAALESDALAEACRRVDRKRLPKRRGKLDVELINKVTEKMPFCYFVSRATIREAFLETKILTKQRCDICGVSRPAGLYSMILPDKRQATQIVCIECMLDAGEREHKARPRGIRRDSITGLPL